MAKSLLEQLPSIINAGKRQASSMLEALETSARVTLQDRELVFPSKDSTQMNLIRGLQEVEFSTGDANRLIYGDNLLAMSALLASSQTRSSLRNMIDLIYIDPPFDSKADYRTKILLPNATIDQRPAALEQFAYSDTWEEGTASYLSMIVPRLVLMRELLSSSGSIFVHLDWHVSHYVKIALDDIFGKENFVNQISWKRSHAHGDSGQGATHFGRVTENLLFYRKSDAAYWNPAYEPYTGAIIDRDYKYTDERTGERYRLMPVDGPGGAAKGNPYYEFLGVSGYWRYSFNTMNELYSNGEIVVSSTGKSLSRKRYLKDAKGTPVTDFWSDIGRISPTSNERLNYPTQKPRKLLERIITTASPKGGLVADFFGGSGTTAEVAEATGRRWIVSDLGKPAIMITRKRLIEADARPFVYQAIGDYQVEQARSTLGRSFRVSQLAQVVLNLYGALPLPHESNVNGSLGSLPGTRTLVIADSPNKLTTASTLRRAQQYRDSILGGFEKVIVLGWNFSAGLGQDIAAIADPHLEVLVIPPDLLDQLKKKGSLEKLASTVRFSSLQYLQASVGQQTIDGADQITVELLNYVLLSPEALNIDDKNRRALQKIMNEEPLSLIEYWAVDPDYDGEVFRSSWQDYRENTEHDCDPLRIVTSAVLTTPRKDGQRTVCVRAVDVFGFESEVVVAIEMRDEQ